jgi:hypothetical protein
MYMLRATGCDSVAEGAARVTAEICESQPAAKKAAATAKKNAIAPAINHRGFCSREFIISLHWRVRIARRIRAT